MKVKWVYFLGWIWNKGRIFRGGADERALCDITLGFTERQQLEKWLLKGNFSQYEAFKVTETRWWGAAQQHKLPRER